MRLQRLNEMPCMTSAAKSTVNNGTACGSCSVQSRPLDDFLEEDRDVNGSWGHLDSGKCCILNEFGGTSLRYEGRGESLESFATLPTPIAKRFERSTRCLVVLSLPLALPAETAKKSRSARSSHLTIAACTPSFHSIARCWSQCTFKCATSSLSCMSLSNK